MRTHGSSGPLRLLALAALAGACVDAPAPAPGAPVAQAAASGPLSSDPAPAPAPEPEGGDEATARVQQILAQVAAQQEQARLATGAGRCEHAYAGIHAVLGARVSGGDGPPAPALPDREAFLSLCADLPEEGQRCMSVAYALAHGAQCRRVRQGLPAPLGARFDAIFPRRGPSETP